MSALVIGNIASSTKARLAAHWADCLEANLTDHSPAAHAAVNLALDSYFSQLASLPRPPDNPPIIKAVEELFSALDEALQRFGSGLLETDERELIVPPVLNGAAEAGLDLTQFADSDPTLPFRTF